MERNPGSQNDSSGWPRMGSEEGERMTSADATGSWQQYYTWCTPYSHPHPHHQSHPQPNHPAQYQEGQYQPQQPQTTSTVNATSHYPSSQQYHLQLQPSQAPPLHQQQQFHPLKGHSAARRVAPYDGPGTQFDFLSDSIVWSLGAMAGIVALRDQIIESG
ncbi:hypothetical protein KM043_017399 [Ampulex compressa]|nr:hypothetical protein KM043_017399 [Ampulex compressa]